MIDPNIVNRKNPIPAPEGATAFLAALSNEYNMPLPKLSWYEMDRGGECGGWYVHGKGEIIIVASGNPLDDAHSIAHEYAHYITDEGHSPAMYAALIDITERFSMDYQYMWRIEMGYQPKHFVMGLVKRSFANGEPFRDLQRLSSTGRTA